MIEQIERIYIPRNSIHGFQAKEVYPENYEEVVRKIKRLPIRNVEDFSDEINYMFKCSFTGKKYSIYGGICIEIGKVSNEHTPKGKEVNMMRISAVISEHLCELEKKLGL